MIIYVDDIPVDVELADCDPTRQLGLMYRHHLPENTGMLFSWPDESIRSFWMKNTTLPLSIAYISSDGRVLNVEDLNAVGLLVNKVLVNGLVVAIEEFNVYLLILSVPK